MAEGKKYEINISVTTNYLEDQSDPASDRYVFSYTINIANVGTVEGIIVIDVAAEDLDIDGGFDCLRATIADVGTTAQIGGMLYFLHEPRNASATLPTAIED